MERFLGINSALRGMSRLLLEEGKWRETRGHRCLELSYPITIEIEFPHARLVMIPERKWNWVLPFAESVWLALGWNNLDDFTGHYVKNLYSFSDDGHTWRGGYGSRFRYYSPSKEQYNIGKSFSNRDINSIDQFWYIIEAFRRDPNTRQAIITISDPNKDSFDSHYNILETKDFPCTRELHFMKSTEGKLNLITQMRSNDILWGFSAVNNFNFTYMQEYFSYMLNLPMGSYFHKVDNFHVYEQFFDQIKIFAEYSKDEVEEMDIIQSTYIPPSYFSIANFDQNIDLIEHFEKESRKGNYFIPPSLPDLFKDTLLIFIYKNAIKRKEVFKIKKFSFINSSLETIVKRSLK